MLTSSGLDRACGALVFAKAECLQVTGAFKFRGASNAIRSLTDAERAAGVVTFSSGNHAQAVARAAAMAGTTSVVVMPHDAPDVKVEATAAAGARLVRYDRYREDRERLARTIADDEGRVLIPPFDHPAVIAGQGTVGLELFDQVDALDAVLVPVGGGGLLAGVALAARRLAPGVALYGVEPVTGDDHRRSLVEGHRVEIPVPETIADGQQVTSPGRLTWPITSRAVRAFLTVTDDEIVAAMKLVRDELDLVVEPSGACALAALLADRSAIEGDRVGVVLSGGNVDPARCDRLLG